MRLLKIFLSLVLFCGVLPAADSTADLQASMATMENALTNIQKGFLYNNMALVRNGASEISKCTKMCYKDPKDVQKMMPKDRKLMGNAAVLISKRMRYAAEELLIYLDQKNIGGAHDSFANIENACMDCHKIVRNW